MGFIDRMAGYTKSPKIDTVQALYISSMSSVMSRFEHDNGQATNWK